MISSKNCISGMSQPVKSQMSSEYIKNIRKKIGHSVLMISAVAAVILNDSNELLLQEKHGEPWSLPAGMIEPGESPKEAVIREVMEETGLLIEPVKILGVFGGKEFRHTYPNGDQVEYTVILIYCLVQNDTGVIGDPETKSLKYFDKASCPELALPYPREALFNEIPGSIIQ